MGPHKQRARGVAIRAGSFAQSDCNKGLLSGVLRLVTILAAAHEPLATGTGGGARFRVSGPPNYPIANLTNSRCQH